MEWEGLMDAIDDENGGEEDTLAGNPYACSGELKVGIKVCSEDEAYNLYNEYALSKGFSVRKGNKRRDLNGTLRQREYLCSKAGYRKIQSMGEVKEFNHLETRTDCKATIRFTIDDGIWTISHLNDVHNHELATSQERRNLRSGRKMVKAYGDVPMSADNHNHLYPTISYDQSTIPTEVSCSTMELNSSRFSYMRLLVEGDAIPQLSQESLVMGVEMLPPQI